MWSLGAGSKSLEMGVVVYSLTHISPVCLFLAFGLSCFLLLLAHCDFPAITEPLHPETLNQKKLFPLSAVVHGILS